MCVNSTRRAFIARRELNSKLLRSIVYGAAKLNLRTRKILRTLEHRSFVAVIISTRKGKKMTQEDVAKKVARLTKTKKPDRSWISRIESGERVLAAVELTWLADAMDELPETLVAKARKWVEVERGK